MTRMSVGGLMKLQLALLSAVIVALLILLENRCTIEGDVRMKAQFTPETAMQFTPETTMDRNASHETEKLKLNEGFSRLRFHYNQTPFVGKQCHQGKEHWQCQECFLPNETSSQEVVCKKLEPKGVCRSFRHDRWDNPPRSYSGRARKDESLVNILTHYGIANTYEQPACSGGLLSSCFDLSRCDADGGPLHIYAHGSNTSQVGKLLQMAADRIPSIVKQVSDPSQACLLLLGPDSYSSYEDLLSSPAWNGGKNHFIWRANFMFRQNIDFPFHYFHFGSAAMGTSSFTEAHARIGYDMSLFLAAWWRSPLSIQQMRALEQERRRPLLLSLKGKVNCGPQPWFQHRWLAAEFWDDGDDDVFVDVQCEIGNETHQMWNNYTLPGQGASYLQLLLNSTFVFCPGGYGGHSYRWTEALSAGAIPVVTPELWAPFSPELDWSKCLVRVPEERIVDLPRILRQYSTEDIERRQAECATLLERAIGQDSNYHTAFRYAMEVWHVRVSNAFRTKETRTNSQLRGRGDPK